MWLENLRAMKAASGLTTKEIAAGAQIPETTLAKLFSGATKEPKLSTITQLVHFLGHTLDELEPMQKETAAPEIGASDKMTRDELVSLLVGMGYINPGQDLSNEDLRFLLGIGEVVRVWFTKS